MRPIASKQIIREYTYAYGVVFPEDGDFDGFILPTMDTPAMNIFLKEISKRHPEDYILMVVDGAACHRGGELKIPDNIELLQLPPYSPVLNPVENLWDEMREKWFGSVVFKSMDAVEDRLITALLDFESDPKKMKSISGWDWILKSIE